MRYIAVEWLGKKPSKEEIYEHLRRVIGEIGIASADFKFVDGFIACNEKWVDKIRGALALKWQFRVVAISGTLKKLRKKLRVSE